MTFIIEKHVRKYQVFFLPMNVNSVSIHNAYLPNAVISFIFRHGFIIRFGELRMEIFFKCASQ